MCVGVCVCVCVCVCVWGGGGGGSRDLWGWAPGTCNLSLCIRSKFFLSANLFCSVLNIYSSLCQFLESEKYNRLKQPINIVCSRMLRYLTYIP